MKHSVKGLIVAGVAAAIMWVGWLLYKDFLTHGMRPPEGTVILNKMEKEGVPDFALKNLEGETVKLSDFRGKLVLLNFWASWCDPCVEEFPSMMSLLDQFKDNLVLVAVSNDNTEDEMRAFLKAFGGVRSNMVVLWDKDREVSQKFGTKILPESYIIDQQGKLLRKIVGVEKWDDPMAIQFFEELIKKGAKVPTASEEENS